MGPSTKLGRSLKKNIQRTKKALERLLDQRAMWLRVGDSGDHQEDHRVSPESLKAMLRSAGGEMPWMSSGAGLEMYLGKLVHRCTSDLERCIEEVSDLRVQKDRLSQWLLRTSDAIDKCLASVQVESGRYILLCRWSDLITRLIEEWAEMSW